MNERIDAFLAYLSGERGLSGNTISAYRNDLTQFGEFLRTEAVREGKGSFPLGTVDRERLAGFFLSLRERGYAPATVARKVAALKSFFHYLRRLGEVAADPTDGLGAPEVKKVLPRAISAAAVDALVDQAQRKDSPEGFRDTAMLRTLYATGMRVSELVMLNTTDVNLADGTVRVVGRGGRERTLPLDPVTVSIVRSYTLRAWPFLVHRNPSQPALFLNHRGQRLTRQGFWLIMKALVKESGLPIEVTPHTLRHSFATHKVGGGLALEQLRQLLGHASISTTQIYAQVVSSQAVPPVQAAPEAGLTRRGRARGLVSGGRSR